MIVTLSSSSDSTASHRSAPTTRGGNPGTVCMCVMIRWRFRYIRWDGDLDMLMVWCKEKNEGSHV